MKYKSYRTSVNELINGYKNHNVSPSEWYDIINDTYLREHGVRYDKTLDYDLNLMELSFLNHGSNLIFLDNDVANYLFNLKFSAQVIDELPLPFPSFAISPSTNAKVGEIKLRPILVTDYDSRIDACSVLAKAFNQPLIGERDDTAGVCFSIAVPINDSKDSQKLQISFNSKQLKEIIDCGNDVDKTHAIVGSYGNCLELNHEEQLQLVISLKLVVGLCLYNHITQGQFLRKGFPIGLAAKPKHLGLQKSDFKSTSGLVFKLEDKLHQQHAKAQHVRSGHFRQLMADRFYQGEWASWSRGSRWVEVKPSIVGEGKPHTQETV